MTQARELAAALRARVLDRIEDDRAINSANVEEAILDGLLLREAKTPSQSVAGSAQEVYDAAAAMMSLLLSDTALLLAIPRKASDALEQVYRALLRTGWKP